MATTSSRRGRSGQRGGAGGEDQLRPTPALQERQHLVHFPLCHSHLLHPPKKNTNTQKWMLVPGEDVETCLQAQSQRRHRRPRPRSVPVTSTCLRCSNGPAGMMVSHRAQGCGLPHRSQKFQPAAPKASSVSLQVSISRHLPRPWSGWAPFSPQLPASWGRPGRPPLWTLPARPVTTRNRGPAGGRHAC